MTDQRSPRVAILDNVLPRARYGGLHNYWVNLLQSLEVAGIEWRTVARISEAVELDLDVVHHTYYDAGPTHQLPTIITVHDTIYEDHPQLAAEVDPVPNVLDRRADLIRTAQAIVVPSRATQQRLISHYPDASDRTIVVPHAVTLAPPEYAGRTAAESTWLRDLTQDRPFLLHVGGRQFYKGFIDLLAEYLTGAASQRWHLLVVGSESTATEAERRLLDLADNPSVSFTGYVSPTQLGQAYRQCLAYVSASRAEGFGFGPLEAAAHGAPVVCTPLDVHAETVGDWAQPWTPGGELTLEEAVAAAQVRARGDKPALLHRTWDDVAREMIAVYRAAAGWPLR